MIQCPCICPDITDDDVEPIGEWADGSLRYAEDECACGHLDDEHDVNGRCQAQIGEVA